MVKHWIMLRFSAVGDVILTTGVMRHLARKYGLTFTVLTKAPLTPLFEGHPDVTDVVGLRPAELRPGSLVQLARGLSADGSGLLDLHGSLRSRLIGLFWRGPVLRYPKFGLERRLFLMSRGRIGGDDLRAASVTQRYAMAVEKDPPAPEELLPVLRLTEDEIATARASLSRTNSRKPLIAVHPYATHANKAWPAEFWADLGRRLSAQGVDWVVIGKNDRPLAGLDIEGNIRFGFGHDLTNGTTFRETAALLSQTSLLVTGDSGPMHLAASVGTPVVTLFGPTTSEWGFFPRGPEDVVLEPVPNPSCRPCSLHGSGVCRHNQACMRNIAPARVAETIFRILGI